MKDYEYEEELLVYCAECGDIIEELEAFHHSFNMGGATIFFHEDCCPIEISGKVCTSSHE